MNLNIKLNFFSYYSKVSIFMKYILHIFIFNFFEIFSLKYNKLLVE